MSDLKDELQTVEGVGPATADKILDVLEAHDTPDDPLLARAKAAAARGDDRDAAVFLRRAEGE